MPSSASSPPGLSTLSLHDALPISARGGRRRGRAARGRTAPWAAPRRSRRRSGRGLRAPDRVRAQPRGRTRSTRGARRDRTAAAARRSEEHTSELQSRFDLVCRLLLRPPPGSPLFPYTTLFRSRLEAVAAADALHAEELLHGPLLVGREGGQVEGFELRIEFEPSLEAERAPLEEHGEIGRLLQLEDRKSTRLNSSHVSISYAVFCFVPPRALHSFPTRRSSDLGSRRSPPRTRCTRKNCSMGRSSSVAKAVRSRASSSGSSSSPASRPNALHSRSTERSDGCCSSKIGRAHV